MTKLAAALVALVALGCGAGDDAATAKGAGGGGSGGSGGVDPAANPDGDCMTNAEELAKGTNPEQADSDGDGDDDCKELACKSDPLDPTKRCYGCGWAHGDPGNLVSAGAAEGDVIQNLPLVDQCGDTVPIWDFAGDYHLLFMTAVW
ncbi:MAG: hypothetical protein AMXMBFR46_18890 [Acidimicrobiia bacterium]